MTHANSALEAIQRLIGKVELGLVSQVLDTILHVESGKIQQVLELRMTVKPPTGMQEELARAGDRGGGIPERQTHPRNVCLRL